uniref:Uncharacterized protein n=1 Tax=Salix viminalis TaxID=40686 RepID=A0A6N2N1N0_SALVM
MRGGLMISRSQLQGSWLELDDALWEWRRCPSSNVESKCPLMVEAELPSGGLFSVEVNLKRTCQLDLFLALEVVNFSIILISFGLMDMALKFETIPKLRLLIFATKPTNPAASNKNLLTTRPSLIEDAL